MGETRDLLASAANRALRYLETLDQRPVFPHRKAIAGLASLDGPLPEGPLDAAQVLALLDEHGSPATVASAREADQSMK